MKFALRSLLLLVLVMTAALCAFGYRAVSNLSIEAFPDVQDVQVLVVTQYPGQAPEEVERNVTLPIEREMSGVPRQTQLRSVSISGLSIVTLTFGDGTDDYFARQQVLEKLQNDSMALAFCRCLSIVRDESRNKREAVDKLTRFLQELN